MKIHCKICNQKFDVREEDIKWTSRNQPYVVCPCGMSQFISKKKLIKSNPSELYEAIDRYTKFQHKRPSKVIKTEKPAYPNVLVRLGDVAAIIYRKDSDNELYIHEFEDEPTLLTDKKGRNLYILNGNIRVEEAGIIG